MKTQRQGNRGAVLVVVVLAMIAAGLIGTAILSMASSSRLERVQFGITNRAYYLAESGAAYVRARRFANPLFGLAPFHPLTNDFANGDRFVVNVFVTNFVSGAVTGQHVLVESLGIARPGTALEARQRIYFDMHEKGIATNSLPFGLFTAEGEFDEGLWDLQNIDNVYIKETGPSEHQLALNLKTTEGQINLHWQDKPGLNLLKVWAYHGGLLSYDVQTKLQPFETSGSAFSQHYLLGLCFRLHPDTNNCYGLSFFHSNTNDTWDKVTKAAPWLANLDTNFLALRGSNIYVALWYRAAGGATIQLLNSRRLRSEDGLLVDFTSGGKTFPALIDYATLLLQLDEVYNGTNRENRIVAYASPPDRYPIWPNLSSTNAIWQEDAGCFPGPLVWDNGVVTNVDDRITSANFDTLVPSEIGVHVFYDSGGANKTFFNDLAIRVEGFGSQAGGTQIQW